MLEGLDYVVLGLYLAVVAGIGIWAGRGQKSTEDYFLGSRRIPWWAAGLSIIATETSALTFLGAPTQSLFGDWTYLQLAFGSVAARFVVAGVLIPAYYRARVFTVYGYLEGRFGVWTKNAAGILFFVGRSLGSGVRLFGAAIAMVTLVPDLSFPLVIALLAFVAVLYTIIGGIKSVIWTDVLQGLLLLGGGVCALLFLLGGFEEGLGNAIERLSVARPGAVSKLRWLNLDLDPKQAYTLLGGIVGSMFLTMATHGTDQDMIQRALTCKGERGGMQSLWLSAALNIPIVLLFLAIGTALWAQYGGDAGVASRLSELANRYGVQESKARETVFLAYVLDSLPAGIKGLIFAGLFAAAMSSLDSAISALASTAVKNFWQPYVQPHREERHYLRVSRGMAVGFGLVLVVIALVVWAAETGGGAREGFGILMLGLKVLTWIFPPLLGVFLVGVLTPRGRDAGNLLAILVGIVFLLMVEFWQHLFGSDPPFAWVWNSMVGCGLSFGMAVAFPPPREGTREA